MRIKPESYESYNLFTFHSTHAALIMEKELKSAGIQIKIIPVPRAISSSCGLAARTSVGDYEKIKSIIELNEIKIDKTFLMTDMNNIIPVE